MRKVPRYRSDSLILKAGGTITIICPGPREPPDGPISIGKEVAPDDGEITPPRLVGLEERGSSAAELADFYARK